MFTIGLSLRLKPGCLTEYRQAHDNLWPEVADSMRRHQVSMAIFDAGDRLFVFAIAPSEAEWQASRDDPSLHRWNREMTRFLQATPQGELDVQRLEQVFGFGQLAAS